MLLVLLLRGHLAGGPRARDPAGRRAGLQDASDRRRLGGRGRRLGGRRELRRRDGGRRESDPGGRHAAGPVGGALHRPARLTGRARLPGDVRPQRRRWTGRGRLQLGRRLLRAGHDPPHRPDLRAQAHRQDRPPVGLQLPQARLHQRRRHPRLPAPPDRPGGGLPHRAAARARHRRGGDLPPGLGGAHHVLHRAARRGAGGAGRGPHVGELRLRRSVRRQGLQRPARRHQPALAGAGHRGRPRRRLLPPPPQPPGRHPDAVAARRG